MQSLIFKNNAQTDMLSINIVLKFVSKQLGSLEPIYFKQLFINFLNFIYPYNVIINN
jgi:hypothetical protein